MKDGKHTEAVIHYTEAIKHEPSSAVLYSNRSLAFFKIDQLYLAMEDAKKTIKLQPSWPKVTDSLRHCSKNFLIICVVISFLPIIP